MNKELEISQILVYYDFPHIFTAINKVGTQFLCLLVAMDEDLTFVAVSVSNERLARYLSGKIDLRTIFETPEISEWYYFNDVEETIQVQYIEVNGLPDEFLPESGFFHIETSLDNETIIEETTKYGNAIVHLAISDKEDNFSIEADDLGDIMKLYQVVIESTYKKELANRKVKDKDKKFFQQPLNYKLRAFNSSKSSFNLHLYSTSYKDMFGNAIIDIGLKKFHEIISDFKNEEDYIELLKSVKGHSITTLKKLVKKIIDDELTVKHKWFSPNQEKVHFTTINTKRAEKIFNVLNSSSELSEEKRVFYGYFTQVDIKGTWRIYDIEEGKEFTGEANGQLLQGITVESEKYKIICDEIIEVMKVSEKERIKYILKSIQK
jgi:hypothetical protein